MPEIASDAVAKVAALAERRTPEIVRFLREMIAIPSESSQERAVVERVRAEMERLGFDEVKIDGLGNVLGRVGSGPLVVALDGHLDTVGVGDRSTWTRDPYRGEERDGMVYGRGAGDQEGGRRGRRVRGRDRQGARAARRRPALGHGHRHGGGLRRSLLAVHPAREGARARRRGHHRADQPRRLPGPARTHGDGGADAGALGARLDARARRQRGLQDGADRRRRRAAEPAPRRAARPLPRHRARSRSPTSAPPRRRSARSPTAARSTSTAGSPAARRSSPPSPRSRRCRASSRPAPR